jgi:hypothetical protein
MLCGIEVSSQRHSLAYEKMKHSCKMWDDKGMDRGQLCPVINHSVSPYLARETA